MNTIDVSSKTLTNLGRQAQIVQTNISCCRCCCKKIVAGKIPNNEPQSWIYGVVIPHYRIVWGIHENVSYLPHEETICFCLSCGETTRQKVPHVFESSHPKEPTQGGHFITVCKLATNGNTECFSRFQSGLSEFREIMKILKT